MFVLLIAFTYVVIAGINYYQYKRSKEVLKSGVLLIPTGSELVGQAHILIRDGFLKDSSEFISYASRMGYKVFRSGRYQLTKGMSYSELFTMLGRGYQSPTKMIFNNVYSKETLAARLARYIELDSTQIVSMLTDSTLLSEYNLTPETVLYKFIPNTYEVYWNMSPRDLLEHAIRESDRFWASEGREEKREELGMTRDEVMILASIVNEEYRFASDAPLVASVYLNRLRRGIALAACPTIKYAVGDRTLRRILTKHLEIDSPYNTYKHAGLPPTAITIPSITAIDAVLENRQTDYLYFCASHKLDGTHCYSRTLAEHNRYSRLYQKELDRLKIYK